MRTLADLIAFNDAHCPQEMPYYGQEVFLLAEMFPGYPNDPAYIAARTHARSAARSGIDNVINSGVDAIVAPHLTNSTGPAVSGYPNLSLPVGIRNSGRPAGMLMRAASGGENVWRAQARKFCRPTQDYQDDADAPEFDACGHCAMCIQPDSPGRWNVERDTQSWPRDRGANSRSFFVDAPDVVQFCSRLRPSLSSIFRRLGRGKSFPLCVR